MSANEKGLFSWIYGMWKKCALAKELSFATKLPFYDMDTEIEKKTGLTIPEIFEKHGEDYFRKLETEFLLYVSR